jgi:hypothetical protein
VPPGEYVLHTRTASQNNPAPAPRGSEGTAAPVDPGLWADESVSIVDRDVALTVTMHAFAHVSGRMIFDGNKEKLTPEAMRGVAIVFPPLDDPYVPGILPTRADTTGAFLTTGLSAGRYLLVAFAPPGWALKSALLNGKDISDSPFDVSSDVRDVIVTFTDRPTAVSGTVRTDAGAPDRDASVLVFPADPNMWTGYGVRSRRYDDARVAASGAYTIKNLPPGDYFIAAVAAEVGSNWQDQPFLEQLHLQAARIHLDEGQQLSKDLKTVVIK